ncbi:MAG: aspartate-semialdehyde dehydrogenase [Christensenellales bacterium]
MNIAIVGVTGKVGGKFVEVLHERNIQADQFFLYASAKSTGKKIKIFGKEVEVLELKEENIVGKKIDYALFSCGGELSKKFVPKFVEQGAVVIDNSSAWRMNNDVPLVVPEVNKEDIFCHHGIISNPNCSTIQAVLPLKALDAKFGIKRVIFSTYQSVSGAGQRGVEDLKTGINGGKPKKFLYPIFSNVIPHIDIFEKNGYTKEENKMILETRKILHKKNLKITATTVRVPVFDCHSESVNVELKKPFKMTEIRKCLSEFENIVVIDDIKKNLYPMPLFCRECDEVFVGRIRRDSSCKNAINLWIVADNIRKGAATNAVQILQELIKVKDKK